MCAPENVPDETLALESCRPFNDQSSSSIKDGSWFVRGITDIATVKHEVCVLRQHDDRQAHTNEYAPITLITYPTGSAGGDGDGNCLFADDTALENKATHAFTHRPIDSNNCLNNGDGTKYKLSVTSNRTNPVYTSVTDCKTQCD